MTKVGLYAIWRLWPLLFGHDASPLDGLVAPWLWALALATLLFAAVGALAATRLAALAAWLVLVSVGSLMAVITVATIQAWAAGFYYLLHSTWSAAALFLLVGLISSRRGLLADQLRSGNDLHPSLGILFVLLAVMLVGLPPLSGFIGKLLLLQAVPAGIFWAVLLGSSLMVLVAFSRAGSTVFWRQQKDAYAEKMPFSDLLPLLLLLAMTFALIVFAGPTYEAMGSVAEQLMNSQLYIEAVLGEQEVGQ